LYAEEATPAVRASPRADQRSASRSLLRLAADGWRDRNSLLALWHRATASRAMEPGESSLRSAGGTRHQRRGEGGAQRGDQRRDRRAARR
jgi:hypothetical protein